jgi:hypothetical protein
VRISANELYSRCDRHLYWRTPYEANVSDVQEPGAGYASGPSFSVELDNDGNATAIVLGGPSCAAGESLIAAHLESAPYTTVTTGFTVMPPRPSTPGVFATPASKVEGEVASDVATIVQVEFPPVYAEQPVNVQGAQLYSRCKQWPHTEAIVMEEGWPQTVANVAEGTIYLDNEHDRSEPRKRSVHDPHGQLHDRTTPSDVPARRSTGGLRLESDRRGCSCRAPGDGFPGPCC